MFCLPALLFAEPAPGISPQIDVGQIIEKSAASALGIVALTLVMIAFLALYFFRNDSPRVRLTVFFTVLVVGVGLFGNRMMAEYENEQRAAENDRKAKIEADMHKHEEEPAKGAKQQLPPAVKGRATSYGDCAPAHLGNGDSYSYTNSCSGQTSAQTKKK